MPKSKGRQKAKKRAYTVRPAKKQHKKSSPRWYGPLIIGVMAIGVILIVMNYIGLMPGTNGTANNEWLWVGLGLIGAGFVGTTFWR